MTHENQRNGRRLAIRLPFSLVVESGTKVTINAESINVSKSGMRLRTDSRLALGQTVEVILLEGNPYPVAARVVWASAPSSPDQYEVGLEYVSHTRTV